MWVAVVATNTANLQGFVFKVRASDGAVRASLRWGTTGATLPD